MIYAYARVSTKEQNLDRQIAEFSKIQVDSIIQEKESGKDFINRTQYQNLKNNLLKSGDTLVILSIDRLGRNYDEILTEWAYFKEHNIYIQVLDMPILNTKNNINGLDGRFISDLVLQILSYVAQKERDKIKERQEQGIKSAREKGVKFGRPVKKVNNSKAKRWVKVYNDNLLNNGGQANEIIKDACQDLGISRGKFFNDYLHHSKVWKTYQKNKSGPIVKEKRAKLEDTEIWKVIAEKYWKYEIGYKEACEILGISDSNFYYHINKYFRGKKEK